MRMSKKFNKKVRESTFFRQTGIANNSVFRKSMAIPDDNSDSLAELEKLFEEDEKAALNEQKALNVRGDNGITEYT